VPTLLISAEGRRPFADFIPTVLNEVTTEAWIIRARSGYHDGRADWPRPSRKINAAARRGALPGHNKRFSRCNTWRRKQMDVRGRKQLKCGSLATSCAALLVLSAGPSMVMGDPVPDFSLPDVNETSPRFPELVSPRDYLGGVSAWYFGRST